MITETRLKKILHVNGQAICDCKNVTFEVGMTAAVDDHGNVGNNFIRVLECIECHKQMTVVHHTDAFLAPSLSPSQFQV